MKAVVYFFLDGERYGIRQWHHVPRVGDEVMLSRRRGDDREGKMPCKVLRVVWGVEAETDPLDFQAVNVEIENVE